MLNICGFMIKKSIIWLVLLSLTVATLKIVPEPFVFGEQEVVYSEKYQSLGFFAFVDEDVEIGKAGFEVDAKEETGGTILFMPLDEDKKYSVGQVVSCYSANDVTSVWSGVHSDREFKLARLVYWFFRWCVILCVVLVMFVEAACLLKKLLMLKGIFPFDARHRTIEKFCLNEEFAEPLFYVKGLSNKEVMVADNMLVENGGIAFVMKKQKWTLVDEVYYPDVNDVDVPIEGDRVLAIRNNLMDDWIFIATDVSPKLFAVQYKRRLVGEIVSKALMLLSLVVLLVFVLKMLSDICGM